MNKLMNIVGPWVEKERLWDRENELAELEELLCRGANILITAPRRIGKTSLIRETGNRLAEKYYCLQLDLQKSNSPADVIAELSVATRPHQSLWKKTTGLFANFFGTAISTIDSLSVLELGIKFRDGLISNWQDKGDGLMAAIAQSEKTTVIFMDEFPLLINRLLKGDNGMMTPEQLKETEMFLSWIRSLTILYNQKIRLVITGSIGLEPILHQAGLSHTMNTFTPFLVEPWDTATSTGCLQALANQSEVCFQPGATDKIIETIGCCIPHHVQMFFSFIYKDCKNRKDMNCAMADVTRVYKTYMLSSWGHVELTTYEERLKTVLPLNHMPLAIDLLTETAITKKLTAEAVTIISSDYALNDGKGKEAIRDILGILEHDGYLIRQTKGYVFKSKLLQDWWKARFGFQFTPAKQRNL